MFSLPGTELLKWVTGLCSSFRGSGTSRVQGITWPHRGKCALCSGHWLQDLFSKINLGIVYNKFSSINPLLIKNQSIY